MKSFYEHIVNNPRKIIVCFLTLAIMGAIIQGLVKVNYDITDYLPENSPSTIAMEVMKEEFEGGIPNARVMVENVTVPEALDYKNAIENCEGVTDVVWLDDTEDVLQPIETMNQDAVDTYYKNNAALFTVTIEDGCQVEAVEAIRSLPGTILSGDAVSTAETIST